MFFISSSTLLRIRSISFDNSSIMAEMLSLVKFPERSFDEESSNFFVKSFNKFCVSIVQHISFSRSLAFASLKAFVVSVKCEPLVFWANSGSV